MAVTLLITKPESPGKHLTRIIPYIIFASLLLLFTITLPLTNNNHSDLEIKTVTVQDVRKYLKCPITFRKCLTTCPNSISKCIECKDTKNDNLFCGSCLKRCLVGQTCINGKCIYKCNFHNDCPVRQICRMSICTRLGFPLSRHF
jgi:hypothetical protein